MVNLSSKSVYWTADALDRASLGLPRGPARTIDEAPYRSIQARSAVEPWNRVLNWREERPALERPAARGRR